MKLVLILLTLLSIGSLEAATKPKRPNLVSIQIVDRNGFSETINLKDRLEQFEKVNFLQPQAYQKVMRTYERDAQGNIPSFLTSYYPNGQIKQYLEVINSRANGLYQEWYPYGQKKLSVKVIGGQAEFDEAVQVSWMFDGVSMAYTEDGKVAAKINYNKGTLEGRSEHFYPNGNLKLSVDYKAGVAHGEFIEKYSNGTLSRKVQFNLGIPDGEGLFYWPDGSIAGEETFTNGLLMQGCYYPKTHDPIVVSDGKGKRMTLQEGRLFEVIEISQGVPYGKVWLYNKDGRVDSIYHTRNGQKQGEETIFYPSGGKKLVIDWHEDAIHGIVKSYYPNGTQTSQTELSKNKKQGLLTAWYPTGDIMLLEEYENDLLQSGRYFKKGEAYPISTVEKGNGTATLYDPDGTFGTKITYENGSPLTK